MRIASCLALLVLVSASELSAQRPVRREDAQFVASSRGQVYYWIGCDAWRRLSPRNLQYFRTAPEAEAAGYRASESRGCAPQRDTALIEARIGGSAPCTVSRIVDGDTFVCEGGSRVRLLLVDSDELGQSVFADSAAALLRQLMPPGSRVRLEFDVELFDRYRRVLAYVYTDAAFVNRLIARRGFGHVVVYPPNIRMVEVLRAAADTARQEKLGIWRGSAFECTPAEFRARRC
ncbi:MAG: thermonuclease family protein [Longimicrobiales bacterium]